MKLDEIKKELQQLNRSVADHNKKISDIYGEELPTEPEELSRGLRFKLNSDLFSGEERTVNEALQDIIVRSLRLERSLSEELSAITRAQHRREQYTEVISGGADLVTLYKETDETLQRAQTVSKELSILSKALQNIACNRYFNGLTHKGKSRKADKHRAILAEIDAIGNGADAFTVDGEKARNGGFIVVDNRGDNISEKLTQLLESVQAVNLLCYYSNDFYELHYSTILPTNYQDLATDKQKSFIRETIEPCFKSHITAIKALHYPTAEADTLITKAVESIYSQLNIIIETGGEEDNGNHQILTKAVENYLMPHTAITKAIFNNRKLEPVVNEAVYEGYEIQNKAVNTYISILPNLEGVEGLEKLTAQELGLVCAVANEAYAGNEYVTPQMLKKAWSSSKSSKIVAGSKEEQSYIKSINTMRKTDIKIDQREYRERKGLNEDFIERHILDLAKAYNVTINGATFDWCWKILDFPPVIQHAINLGQITTTPAYLMDTGVNAKYLPLRDYLWNEVHRIKSDTLNTETAEARATREAKEKKKAAEQGQPYKKKKPKQTPIILFGTIYEKLYPTADTRAKREIQKNAQKILQFWAKHGVIKSFCLQYDGINRKQNNKKQNSLLADAVKIDVTATEIL